MLFKVHNSNFIMDNFHNESVYCYHNNLLQLIKHMSVDNLQSAVLNNLVTQTNSYFEYSILEAKTRMLVQQRTNEIKTLMRRTSQDIIDVGQKLIDVKQHLGHGGFRSWLKSEFNWSISAATKFMQVAEQFKCVNFAHLNITASALYLIAAPSTPQEAREAVLEKTKLGENVSYTQAKEIISQYKKIAKPKFDEPLNIINPANSTPKENSNVKEAEKSSLSSQNYQPPVAEDEQITNTIKDECNQATQTSICIETHVINDHEILDKIIKKIRCELNIITPEQLILLIIKATNRELSKHQLEAIITASREALNMEQ